MSADKEPIADTWYREQGSDRTFFVTGVDEDGELIEIQRIDGGIDEIGLAEWSELDLELAESPGVWRDPVDRPDEGEADSAEAAAEPWKPS